MDKALIQQVGGTLTRNLLVPTLAYFAARGLFPSESIDAFATGVFSLISFGWGWYVNRAPDGSITQETWYGAVRNLASPLVAWSAGKGWITNGSAEVLIAGVSSVTFSAWGVYTKWKLARAA